MCQSRWPPPALLSHAAEFRLPGPLKPDARDLVSAYTGTAEQSCKIIDSYADLSKLRTVDHDMYSKFVKIMDVVKSQRKSIPPASKEVGWDSFLSKLFYPTYLEKGGMGKISIPATQVG